MSSTKYIVRLGDNYVHVTFDEISSTGQTFRLGRVKFSHSQRLKVCIGGELVSSIGLTNEGDERNLAIIAGVFKLLTARRDVEAATKYIKTKGGKAWLHKLVVPMTFQEITKTTGSDTVQLDSHAPNVPQYVNSLSMAQMEDTSQQEDPDSDTATALQVCVMESLVFLLTVVFLVAVFRMLPAMAN